MNIKMELALMKLSLSTSLGFKLDGRFPPEAAEKKATINKQKAITLTIDFIIYFLLYNRSLTQFQPECSTELISAD